MQPIATKIIDSVKAMPPGTKLSMDDLRKIIGDRDKIAADRKKNQQVYYSRRCMLNMGLLNREATGQFVVTGKINEEAPKRRTRKAATTPRAETPTLNGNGAEITVNAPLKVRVVKGQIEASLYGSKVNVSPERLLQEIVAQKP